MYGLSERDIGFTEDIADSSLVVLPMSWNYYRRQSKIPLAMALVQRAATDRKKVLSWTNGDFGVKVPPAENLTVLRQSGYRSRLPASHQGMPVFFGDPLKRFYDRDTIFLREKGDKPVIGFCGQAKGTLQKYALDVSRTFWRNAQYYLGRSPNDPQNVYPSTLRRARILEAIEKDKRLAPNFIKRSQYRAGADTPETRRQTALEFYDNMVQSDYILCVRGGGNFSVRLYETLAMGRIPVFVNTDCLLPLRENISWKKHVVWVEQKEISRLPEIIEQFHTSLSDQAFIQIQQENREIWAKQLTLGAFYKSFLLNILNEKVEKKI